VNLHAFVIETTRTIVNFDGENIEDIKKVIRNALEFYNLHSYEEFETTELGSIRFLHVHSMIEENLLSKIVEIAMNGEGDLNIEGLYKGHIIRNY